MTKNNSSPNWILRAIFMRFVCIFGVAIMAGFVGVISFIVMKLCGFSAKKAQAVSSDVSDKVAFVLFVLVLTTGAAYWIWRGLTVLRDRKLPPPLPGPPPLPVPPPPVPSRPRALIQEAVSLVALPPLGNSAATVNSNSGNQRAGTIMSTTPGADIRGNVSPMRLGKNCPEIFDQPVNTLEQRMIAAREREISMEEFLRDFFESEVAVLVPEGQFGVRDGIRCLVDHSILFSLTYSGHAVVGLFTDVSRAEPVRKLHPEFRFAAMVNAGSMIRGLQPGHGFAINPYWDINMEWNGEQTEWIKTILLR